MSTTPATAPTGRDDLLEHFVAARVSALQRDYLADRSNAVGALARLRRAVGTSAGADPETWGETLAGLPQALLGHDDTASAHEQAAHAAITLFAVHQQSGRGGVHRTGQSLGTAVRLLGQRTGSDEAVRRRFLALGTASSLPETLHHLRGLVTQLRSAGIPLDYGRLARDLRRLQRSGTADGVRLAWGRDYHRVPATGTSETTTTDDLTGDQ